MAVPMVPLLTLLLAAAPQLVAAIQCWGANAIRLQQAGEKPCHESVWGYNFNSCWESCGGVSYFPGQCGSEFLSFCPSNPSGKYLCPALLGHGCNCSAWPGLPGNACPKCDDFSVVPPLMMSLYPDAEYLPGIELGECPHEYDTCFSYCVTKSMSQGGGSVHCAYGCAQREYEPVMELVVASRLSDVDYEYRKGRNRNQNNLGQFLTNARSPINYKCTSSDYGCQTTFCTTDGCNKGAMTFYARWGRKLIIGFWLSFGLLACCFCTPAGELLCQVPMLFGATCAGGIAQCCAVLSSLLCCRRPKETVLHEPLVD